MRLTWLAIAILIVLALAGAAALVWRRVYRDDPENAARRIFKNSAVTFSMRMVVKALDMVVFYIISGTFAARILGDYDLAALLVAQFLQTFAEFGLGVLLTREAARDPGAARRLFGVTLGLRMLLIAVGALPIALLVIGAYALIGQPISPDGRAAILILCLTLIPGAYTGAVTALYNASERMEVPALMELVTSALSFLVRIAVITLGFGIIGLAWSAVGVTTFTAFIFLLLQRRHFFPPTVSWDVGAMRMIVPTAFPLMLNTLLAAVFFRFDIFIIRAFGGADASLLVAQYQRPYTVLNLALIVPPAVTFAVFPLLARRAGGDRAGMASAQSRTLQIMMLLAFPLAMGISVLARELIQLFTRSQFADYQPSVIVLAILAWFLPLSFANGLLQYALIAVDRQAAITRAFLIGAAFNFTANVLAIGTASLVLGRPEWGLYAAAAITIVSELVLYLVFLPLLRREGLAPSLARMSWRPALAALVMGAAMVGLKLVVPEWQGAVVPGWPGAVLAALVAPPVYLAALWALGGVGADERALALRIIGRSPQ